MMTLMFDILDTGHEVSATSGLDKLSFCEMF